MKPFQSSVLIFLFSILSTNVLATNFQDDSFDIYQRDVNGDGHTDYVFIAKEKLLLLHSSVTVPIQYKDADSFALLGADDGTFTISTSSSYLLESGTLLNTSNFEVADLNGDGRNDYLFMPNGTSGSTLAIYGNSNMLIASVETTDTFQNIGSNTATVEALNVDGNQDGLLVTDTDNGYTWLIDRNGEPFNPTRSPKEANYPGSVEGSLTVTSGGSANYRFPIDVPAGPAGIQPNLALVYDSHSGNGLLGLGWKLSGLEVISRCSPSKPNSSYIRFNEQDDFCYNGQRLVKISETGTVFSRRILYRTEIDNGQLIKAFGSEGAPSHFIVYQKNGTVKEFGNTSDSKVEVAGDATKVKFWALNKKLPVGTLGYSISYEENNTSGEHYVSKIEYGAYRIDFNYEERPDRKAGFRAGYRYSKTKRLKSIRTLNNGSVIDEYTMGYKFSKNSYTSYIDWVQKCSGTKCFKENAFYWANQFNGENISTDTIVYDTDGFGMDIGFSDINGDGFTDALALKCDSNRNNNSIRLYYGNDSGSLSNVGADGQPLYLDSAYDDTSDLLFSDVDGDGISDVIQFENLRNSLCERGDTDNRVSFNLSEGAYVEATVQSESSDGNFSDRDVKRSPTLVDINGDGRADVVNYEGGLSGNTKVQIHFANGDGSFYSFGSAPVTGGCDDSSVGLNAYQCSIHTKSDRFLFTDVNGDGRADQIRYPEGKDELGIRIYPNTTDRVFSKEADSYIVEDIFKNLDSKVPRVGDLNNDGVLDLYSYGGKHFNYKLGKGNGLFSDLYEIEFDVELSGQVRLIKEQGRQGVTLVIGTAEATISTLQIRRGGRMRIVLVPVASSSEEHVYKIHFNQYGQPIGSEESNELELFERRDVNGDGALDKIWSEVNYGNCINGSCDEFSVQLNNQHEILKISTIKEGNQPTQRFSYKPMTDEDVYFRGANTDFKATGLKYSINPSTRLVSSFQNAYGEYTYYKYAGARSHNEDGYAGFATVISSTDRLRGLNNYDSIVTATTYSQQKPFVGKPLHIFKSPFVNTRAWDAIDEIDLEVNGSTVYVNGLQTKSGNIAVSQRSRSSSGTASSGFDGPLVTEYEWSSTEAMGVDSDASTPWHRTVLDKKSTDYFDFADTDLNNVINREVTEYVYETSRTWRREKQITKTIGLGEFQKQTQITKYYVDNESNKYEPFKNFKVESEKVVQKAIGNNWKTAIQAEGQLAEVTFLNAYEYYGNGLLYKTTQQNNHHTDLETTYEYDAQGNVTQVSIAPVDGSEPARVTKMSYAADTGYLLTSTNAEGHKTTYSDFDKRGNPSLVVFGEGSQSLNTQLEYDTFGQITKTYDPSGTTTTITRDFCRGDSLIGCEPGSFYYLLTQTTGQPDQYQYFNTKGWLVKTATELYQLNTVSPYSAIYTEYDQHGRIRARSVPAYLPNLSTGKPSDLEKTRYEYDQLDRLILEDAPGYFKKTISYTPDSITGITKVTTRDYYENSVVRVKEAQINTLNQTIGTRLTDKGNSAVSKVDVIFDVLGNPIKQTSTDQINSKSIVIKKGYNTKGLLTFEDDPSRGKYQYSYNGFSEVATSSNERTDIVTSEFGYDMLGRLVSRNTKENTTCWFYDQTSSGKSLGQLSGVFQLPRATGCPSNMADLEATGSSASSLSYSETYGYNHAGLNDVQDIYINDAPGVGTAGRYSINRSFDSYGRLSTLTYPSGDLTVKLNYSSSGYVSSIVNQENESEVYESIQAINQFGKVGTLKLGDLTQTTNYFSHTGLMFNRIVKKANNQQLFNIRMNYDLEGRLTSKTNQVAPVDDNGVRIGQIYTQNFYYVKSRNAGYASGEADASNQLTAVTRSGVNQYLYKYDELGNIQSSTTAGTYSYETYNNSPRLKSVTPGGINRNYTYDAAGNVKSDGIKSFKYTSFNKPYEITSSAGSSYFNYGPANQVIKRTDAIGSSVKNVWTIAGMMDVVVEGGETKHVHRVSENTTVTHKLVSSSSKGYTSKTTYTINDQLGSASLRLTEEGKVIEKIEYTPFGDPIIEYRATYVAGVLVDSVDWQGMADKVGYTGHQHLNHLDLIHMGGRVYDPVIGRMLQPDILVQSPGYAISYNRYAYVMNLPVNLVDPSGYEYHAEDMQGDSITLAEPAGSDHDREGVTVSQNYRDYADDVGILTGGVWDHNENNQVQTDVFLASQFDEGTALHDSAISRINGSDPIEVTEAIGIMALHIAANKLQGDDTTSESGLTKLFFDFMDLGKSEAELFTEGFVSYVDGFVYLLQHRMREEQNDPRAKFEAQAIKNAFKEVGLIRALKYTGKAMKERHVYFSGRMAANAVLLTSLNTKVSGKRVLNFPTALVSGMALNSAVGYGSALELVSRGPKVNNVSIVTMVLGGV